MKKCYILRGLPGSGKSTLAKQLSKSDNAIICEADHHFYDENGLYLFNPKELKLAHSKCISKFMETIKKGQNVIVSNTSTRVTEFQNYIATAEEYGYTVFSIIVENRHGKSNDKGIGQDTLDKMRQRFSISL